MLAYRDGARCASGAAVQRELLASVAATSSDAERATCRLLLQVAELETALADAGAPQLATVRALTDDLASAAVGRARPSRADWVRRIAALELPAELRLVRPEGYAYYALDPLSYADLVRDLSPAAPAFVIGIRSIGTSLAALVRAQLIQQGCAATRLSVRPGGDPWNRSLQFSSSELELFQRCADSIYLVVDEGPGLSGSTFLAVGEALEHCGVLTSRIIFLISHDVAPERLVAPDAARRWRRFSTRTAAATPVPEGAIDISGGEWRSHVYADKAQWPACWPALERRKFLHTRSRELIKFIGHPPYGDAPWARALELADSGFCPPLQLSLPGFTTQPWLTGEPLPLERDRRGSLQRLLEYLVFRRRFEASAGTSLDALVHMTRHNVQEAFGVELPANFHLQLEHAVLADGRLQRHEWIMTEAGKLLKLDAVDHGDDHLFPGPCDAAWDVAGSVIEWGLNATETAELCEAYRARTRDAVALRLTPHLMAYVASRLAQVQMGKLSSPPEECERLERDRLRYSATLAELIAPAIPRARARNTKPAAV